VVTDQHGTNGSHSWFSLTDSSSEDVISAFIKPPVHIFERTCARKPIEESCLLKKRRKFKYLKHVIAQAKHKIQYTGQPFRNSFLQVHKSTTADEENVFCINL
jgi:glucose-6-phosphate isomerase